MAAGGLEARYRRLLGWFPGDHRVVHGEEMLGVLMTGAGPGQDKPRLPETADLLFGAARIRMRPGRALSDRDGWRDALAMFSVAAPVLVLVSVGLAAVSSSLLSTHSAFGPYGIFVLNTYFGQASTTLWLVASGQALVVLLVLLGLRRCAAAATFLYLAVIIGVQEIQEPYTGMLFFSVLFLLVLPVLELVALLASPGPRRGKELLRARHWATLAIGAVTAAAIIGNYDFVSGVARRTPMPWGPESWSPNVAVVVSIKVAGAGVALVLLLAVWLSSAMGKRLAALFALLAYPGLAQVLFVWILPANWWPYWLYPELMAALRVVVVCGPAVIIYRARRRARSFGNSSGQGLA
jgi:hypothetical protein